MNTSSPQFKESHCHMIKVNITLYERETSTLLLQNETQLELRLPTFLRSSDSSSKSRSLPKPAQRTDLKTDGSCGQDLLQF